MVSEERVVELIRPLLAGSDLDLWDVEAGHGLLRVLLDRPGGVDLDALSELTGALSAVLDDHPEICPPGRFHLEVSSPGVERALRRPEHFRAQIGQVVSIKTAAAVGGSRRVHGVLVAADDQGIRLRPEEPIVTDEGEELTLRYEDIQQARTVLVWGPAPRPGQRGRDRRAAGAGRRSVQQAAPARTAATKDDQA